MEKTYWDLTLEEFVYIDWSSKSIQELLDLGILSLEEIEYNYSLELEDDDEYFDIDQGGREEIAISEIDDEVLKQYFEDALEDILSDIIDNLTRQIEDLEKNL